MSRTGHTDLRRALYMPGLVARRHNPVLKVFGDRLSAAGLAPKTVVGAVMRKLTHLIYGVIKSGKPFGATVAISRVAFQDGIWPLASVGELRASTMFNNGTALAARPFHLKLEFIAYRFGYI